MDIQTFQAYAYFISSVLLIIGLYWYIWYLYRGKGRSIDYEKYSDLALKDELDDKLVEARDKDKDASSKNKAEGNKA